MRKLSFKIEPGVKAKGPPLLKNCFNAKWRVCRQWNTFSKLKNGLFFPFFFIFAIPRLFGHDFLLSAICEDFSFLIFWSRTKRVFFSFFCRSFSAKDWQETRKKFFKKIVKNEGHIESWHGIKTGGVLIILFHSENVHEMQRLLNWYLLA